MPTTLILPGHKHEDIAIMSDAVINGAKRAPKVENSYIKGDQDGNVEEISEEEFEKSKDDQVLEVPKEELPEAVEPEQVIPTESPNEEIPQTEDVKADILEDATDDLAELSALYVAKTGNEVPNRFKNDVEWIKSKI